MNAISNVVFTCPEAMNRMVNDVPEHTMNPQSRPFAYPTVSSLDRPDPLAGSSLDVDSDARWNEWAEKGRRENADFRKKARVIAVLAAIGAAGGSVAWFLGSL